MVDEEKLVDAQSGKLLSAHRPARSMAVSPNGTRAIGDYDEGDIDVVYVFKLDGRAIKRTLMQAARVITISANSTWASLQQELDACAVRITGGQYMCWRRYEAMDISSNAHSILLSRANPSAGHDLYIGSVSGTEARRPTLIATQVGAIAVFWPTTTGTSKTGDTLR